MPRFLGFAIIIVLTLLMLPPALIMRARTTKSSQPRIHLVQDMDNQHRVEAQSSSLLFADGRGNRPPVSGTISRGGLGPGESDDPHYQTGLVGDEWATEFPRQVNVDWAFISHGKERFNIFCSACHGYAGYGDGMVSKRAMELMNIGANGTVWVEPKNIHEPLIREQPVGQIFNSITNGIRNMAGYADQISTDDRWAIVAYVKALQRSQNADPNTTPDLSSAAETHTNKTQVDPS